MTQPKFAPILPMDEVREASKLPPAAPWSMHRPGDFRPEPGAPHRSGRGSAGPDQGYAMLLAERFGSRIETAEGEHAADVLQGGAAIAMRRASIYGRAPVAADLEVAFNLFGYLGGASQEMLEARKELFLGLSHDYWRLRSLVDLVPETTLRLTPEEVRERLEEEPSSFRALAGLDGGGS